MMVCPYFGSRDTERDLQESVEGNEGNEKKIRTQRQTRKLNNFVPS